MTPGSEADHGERHGGQPPNGPPGLAADWQQTGSVERCLQLIGLAVRGRRAAVGSDAVFEAIRSRKAAAVFLAEDAGDNIHKKCRDKCAWYAISLVESFTRTQLGRACGRSNTVLIAVTDPGFAAAILKCIGEILGGEAFDETSGV